MDDRQNPNRSVDHQEKGDARRPSDTLDRPDAGTTKADDWQPGRDEGKAKPAA